jgi:hypothetical protein
MQNAPLAKLMSSELAVVRDRVDATAPARAVLNRSASVAEALDGLEQGGFMAEAVRLLAHSLPRREAVWWACMCARHTAAPDLSQADLAALEAAELWVRKPTDENRRAAFARAQEANFGTPEAWACVGAFWAGDSMSPPGQPPVPPAPHLSGAAVAGSVALAAVRGRPERQAQRLARFVAGARDIAAGGPGRLAVEEA